MSFLTTTGFESAGWDEARNWSGLGTPGLMLAGLAIVGGGVATTAGGVRLLRVYALVRHGERELDKLVHPASVGGGGMMARRLRREGAYISWIFFMLFALSIAVVMVAVSLAGLEFESATVLSIAALSNTGPLALVAATEPLSWGALDTATKAILAGAMILGRLETLAIIALLNPEFWRQ
jgi:trk system potassium uptake protein TrkH